MQPVLVSLPREWEVVVYNNHSSWDAPCGVVHTFLAGKPRKWEPNACGTLPDLNVYARYAAIEHATNDLILTQDDDVIVSDPQAIVNRYLRVGSHLVESPEGIEEEFTHHGSVVCNMPEAFRANYDDAALVGFGACFHRDAPTRAFDRFRDMGYEFENEMFNRECDRVFTVLTPRVLVDVGKTDREFASAPDRLYRQKEHAWSTKKMLDLARQVRDA